MIKRLLTCLLLGTALIGCTDKTPSTAYRSIDMGTVISQHIDRENFTHRAMCYIKTTKGTIVSRYSFLNPVVVGAPITVLQSDNATWIRYQGITERAW